MSKQQVETKDKAYKSVWVWAMLGLFATIFVVNYGFFSVAIGTNPGLVTEKYYKYGLQQNKFDRQFKKQEARGWNVALQIDKKLHINQPSVIGLMVTDKYAQPVSGGRAELRAYRPSDAKEDITLNLEETDKRGYYHAKITIPIQGTWDMNLLFVKGDDKHMLNTRIIIQGAGDAEPTTLEKIVKFITP